MIPLFFSFTKFFSLRKICFGNFNTFESNITCAGATTVLQYSTIIFDSSRIFIRNIYNNVLVSLIKKHVVDPDVTSG